MPDHSSGTPKKETVYQGPLGSQGTAYQGAAVGVKETVYSGPAQKETVFDANKHVSKKVDTSLSRAAMAKSTRSSAIRFLIVALLSGLEYMSYKGENAGVSTTSLLTCIIFVILAFFAYKMSRGAFLAAILIYGGSTLLMLAAALTTAEGFMYVLKPLIARCILIYNLHQKYCQLTDLYELENV
jgi:hypothetical protein